MNRHTRRIIRFIEGEKSLGLQFYEKTKLRKIIALPPAKSLPQSWKTIHYKMYPRLRAFTASGITAEKNGLTKLLHARRSTREFNGSQLAFNDLFFLLKNAAGITHPGSSPDESTRAYASAGARYPLELYTLALNVAGLAPGLYHYSVKEELIELLSEENPRSSIKQAFGEEAWIEKAAAILLITGVPERVTVKYGERGHRFMYIETGLLAQNISLLATDIGLDGCLIGGFIEDEVIQLLDLQIQSEYPLLAIAVGGGKTVR